jgi:sugar-specific transcriptional regulator TrmB
MDINFLKKLGFSEKESTVYLELLRLGPSPVRKIAEVTGLNRGTTYDALKWLQDLEVVSFYNKESKQYFVAENPDKLQEILRNQEMELKDVKRQLEGVVPELQALYNSGGNRPVARYFEGDECKKILEDVLFVCEKENEKIYRVYSVEGLREHLYKDFPTFSDVRIAKGIAVKAIAIGEGGTLRGLDERKWLKGNAKTPTYIFIYPGKTAYISFNAHKEPVGVVIENAGVYETQKLVFDSFWNLL